MVVKSAETRVHYLSSVTKNAARLQHPVVGLHGSLHIQPIFLVAAVSLAKPKISRVQKDIPITIHYNGEVIYIFIYHGMIWSQHIKHFFLL